MQEASPDLVAFDRGALSGRVVTFAIGARCCAVALDAVERVIAAVEAGPLIGAPAAIFGVINLHGTVIPILDVRPRFGDPVSALRLDQKLLVVRTPQRLMAVLADRVEGVRLIPRAAVLDMADLVPGAGAVQGCAADGGALVYLYDADRLLTGSEEAALSKALEGSGS